MARHDNLDTSSIEVAMITIPVAVPIAAKFPHMNIFMNCLPTTIIMAIFMPVGGKGECGGGQQAKA